MAQEWIPTNEAARLAGYQPERIRELLRTSKIEGRKFSTLWMVNPESLRAYLIKMQKRGAKSGPKIK